MRRKVVLCNPRAVFWTMPLAVAPVIALWRWLRAPPSASTTRGGRRTTGEAPSP